MQEANLSERLYPNLGGLSPDSSFKNELLSMQYSYTQYEAAKARVEDEYKKSEEYNRHLRYNIDKGFTRAQTQQQKEAEFKAISQRRERNKEIRQQRLKAIDQRIQKLEKNASTSQIWDFDKGRS